MKPSELNEILKDVIAEEMAIESYIGHPDWDEEHGDGYTNDYQRAFAHSRATNPVPEGDKKKAEALAKKGKFVVIANNDVHCKTTDAVLGSCISIEGIFDTYEEAEKKANEIGSYMDGVGVITPDSVNNPPKEHSYPPPGTEDDVPFQEALGLSIKNAGDVDDSKPLTGLPGVKGLAQNTKGFNTDRFSKPAPTGKYRWTDGMHKALEKLNRRFKQGSLANPASAIQDMQDRYGLSDQETYLVAATSDKPPTPDVWNKMGSQYARFVGTKESVKEVNATTDSSGKTIAAVGAPGSVARFTTENPDAIKQMKDWALDCQWRDQEDIEEMGDEEILRGVQQHYEGGIKQFLRDANSKAEVPVGYKEGYGMGDMEKDPKKAFKGARWTVKYDENSKISVNEVKSIVKEIISEVLNENDSQWNPQPLPQDARQLHEAKGKTSKEKLRSIINESVASVLQESYPDSQLKIKKLVTITSAALNRTSTMEPHEVNQLLKQIYLLAHELLDDRDQPTSTDKWADYDKKKSQEKSALGVTQETISKTKKVLEQMLFQKRNK